MNLFDRHFRQTADPCLLCYDAPCSKNCPAGMEPDRILRSIHFQNDTGAFVHLQNNYACESCGGMCEKACLLKENPIPIRTLFDELHRMQPEDETALHAEPVDLHCSFLGVTLENPFLLSSSVVASTYEKMARAFDMGWAGACFKTICDFIPREASPRYSALQSRQNFYGFKNIEQLSCNTLEEDLAIIRRLKADYPSKVIIGSIMGRNEEEWERLAQLVEEAGADIIECNFSCPNMEQSGLGVDIGQDPAAVARFTAAARRGCTIPLLVKMTPNVTDMRPLAVAAVRNGADGIAAINTVKSLLGMNLDTYATNPSVRGYSGIGGYSGPAVKPIALRFVWELASCPELKDIPISGMGGIDSWKDAVEFLLLGANHVQITTAVMQYGARIIDDLLEGLTFYLQEKALKSVSQLQGLGVENVTALEQLERGTVLLPHFLLSRCIGCGRCYLSCRDGGHEAIRMVHGKPTMNPKLCVGCHLCVLVCPMDAIHPSGKRIAE